LLEFQQGRGTMENSTKNIQIMKKIITLAMVGLLMFAPFIKGAQQSKTRTTTTQEQAPHFLEAFFPQVWIRNIIDECCQEFQPLPTIVLAEGKQPYREDPDNGRPLYLHYCLASYIDVDNKNKLVVSDISDDYSYSLKIFDQQTNICEKVIPISARVVHIAVYVLDDNNPQLVVSLCNGDIQIIDAITGVCGKVWKQIGARMCIVDIDDAQILPGNRFKSLSSDQGYGLAQVKIVSVTNNEQAGTIHFWNIEPETPYCERTISESFYYIQDSALVKINNEKKIFTQGRYSTGMPVLRCWDMATGVLEQTRDEVLAFSLQSDDQGNLEKIALMSRSERDGRFYIDITEEDSQGNQITFKSYELKTDNQSEIPVNPFELFNNYLKYVNKNSLVAVISWRKAVVVELFGARIVSSRLSALLLTRDSPIETLIAEARGYNGKTLNVNTGSGQVSLHVTKYSPSRDMHTKEIYCWGYGPGVAQKEAQEKYSSQKNRFGKRWWHKITTYPHTKKIIYAAVIATAATLAWWRFFKKK